MDNEQDILDPNTDPEKYMAARVRQYVEGIEYIAKSGTNDDSTRLKAYSTLLNKVMPDKTKMDLDIKSQAPYDALKKALEG